MAVNHNKTTSISTGKILQQIRQIRLSFCLVEIRFNKGGEFK